MATIEELAEKKANAARLPDWPDGKQIRFCYGDIKSPVDDIMKKYGGVRSYSMFTPEMLTDDENRSAEWIECECQHPQCEECKAKQ